VVPLAEFECLFVATLAHCNGPEPVSQANINKCKFWLAHCNGPEPVSQANINKIM